MTTVACDLKVMVADKKLVLGDIMQIRTEKLLRIKNELISTAGEWGEGETFIEWYTKRSREDFKPKLSDEFEALVLSKEGIFWYDAHLWPLKITQTPFFAIGSGAVAAMCLMELGKPPKEAIEMVSRWDNLTSFETDTMEL